MKCGKCKALWKSGHRCMTDKSPRKQVAVFVSPNRKNTLALEQAPFSQERSTIFLLRGLPVEQGFRRVAKECGRDCTVYHVKLNSPKVVKRDALMLEKADLILAFPAKGQSPKEIKNCVTRSPSGKFVDTIIYPDRAGR